MKTITLLYHDVVPNEDYSYSGFQSDAANLYKFNIDVFRQHIEMIAANKQISPSLITEPKFKDAAEKPFFLTFDDGGISAFSLISDILERLHWKAHFFVTTSKIDSTGFLSKEQIIELRNMGHLIGSHSHTHPSIFSSLSNVELNDEWRRSKDILESILNEDINTASIPGGFYSKSVASAASQIGIYNLFTSEPNQKRWKVEKCYCYGRYTIFRRLSAEMASSLANDGTYSCFSQWFYWNLKKIAKKSMGPVYMKLRDSVAKK